MTESENQRSLLTEEPRHGSFMRLQGLIRKEFLQVRRDPSSIAIAFLMPVILLLLFGYGVSLDAEHISVAIVVENPCAETESLVGAFHNSKYFDLVVMSNIQQAREALAARQVMGIIYLQSNFTRQLRSSQGAIQITINGTDANTARIVSGYIEGAYAIWLQSLQQTRNPPLQTPVLLRERIWFNSEVRSRNFLVPGLVAVIMTLIGALLTAMVMAREWERGTLESLLVTPVRIREILLGKIIPYFILGTGGTALSVAMAVWLFDVPLRGSIWVLFAVSSLFLITALGMGLLISAVAKSQFVAGQIALIVTFLPAFILSGFIFDIPSMPPVVQVITRLVAARYFVAMLQTLFLAGNIWSVILPNALALAVMASVFLLMAKRKTTKRLE